MKGGAPSPAQSERLRGFLERKPRLGPETVHIDLVPGREVATNHSRDEDVFVAVRQAFDAANRQLEDHARRHGAPAAAAVVRRRRSRSVSHRAGSDYERRAPRPRDTGFHAR